MTAPRTRLQILGLLVAALILGSGRAEAEDLIVPPSVTINRDTTFTNVTILSGGVLTANAVITVTNSLVVDSLGVITHSLHNFGGLRLNVGSELRVMRGGRIHADGRGLYGWHQPTQNSPAQAYNSSGTLTTRSGNFLGGSHGGIGGIHSDAASVWVYEEIEDPGLLGSGGGPGGTRNGCCGAAGGNGGGLIRIIAPTGTVVVDGSITADGQAGDWQLANEYNSGGGAGGSVFIQAMNVEGTGIIRAQGGRAVTAVYSSSGGSGGGGRVAVYYDELTLPVGNITAPSGSGPVPGSAGTVFLRPSVDDTGVRGTLIVDNAGRNTALYTPFRSGITAFSKLMVRHSGSLDISKQISIEADLVVDTAGKLGRP